MGEMDMALSQMFRWRWRAGGAAATIPSDASPPGGDGRFTGKASHPVPTPALLSGPVTGICFFSSRLTRGAAFAKSGRSNHNLARLTTAIMRAVAGVLDIRRAGERLLTR